MLALKRENRCQANKKTTPNPGLVSRENFGAYRVYGSTTREVCEENCSTNCWARQLWKVLILQIRILLMNCMRHGFTQPSRPHSSNSSGEKRVRKIQEYDAARPPDISPRISCNESTPQGGLSHRGPQRERARQRRLIS